MNWFSRLRPSAIDEGLWTSCTTALGEAFENAVYHGQTTLETTTPTSVVVNITDEMIQIRVWDSGPGFNLEQYMRDLPESVPLLAEKGRGLWIIKQIADHLSYSKTANQLNCLTIQKFLKVSDELEASVL